MGVDANINVSVDVKQTGTADLGSLAFTALISKNLNFTAGTDAVNKADILFSDRRTIAASGSENLDLAGALTDLMGATITAAEVVAVFVSASAGNTNNVVIGNATSNGFQGPLSSTGTYTLKPGEFVLMSSKTGWAVTAGTGDLLKIANSGAGTGVTYDIMIIGRSVAA